MTRKRDARDPVLVAMGRELKAIVRAAGKRQVDVAMESGIGLRTVAGYMAGADMPLSAVLRIAPVVGMTPQALAKRLALVGKQSAKKDPPGGHDALADHIRSLGGSEQDVTESLRIVTGDQDVAGGTVDPPGEARGRRRRSRRAQ